MLVPLARVVVRPVQLTGPERVERGHLAERGEEVRLGEMGGVGGWAEDPGLGK